MRVLVYTGGCMVWASILSVIDNPMEPISDPHEETVT